MPQPTSSDLIRGARREAVSVARVRALQELQTACDSRRRAVLEESIVHLDAELVALGLTSIGSAHQP